MVVVVRIHSVMICRKMKSSESEHEVMGFDIKNIVCRCQIFVFCQVLCLERK